jgi:hypothetical protein
MIPTFWKAMLPPSSTLKMEAAWPSKMLVFNHHTIYTTQKTIKFTTVYISLPLDTFLSQFNPIYIFASYFSKINFNIILQCTPMPPR